MQPKNTLAKILKHQYFYYVFHSFNQFVFIKCSTWNGHCDNYWGHSNEQIGMI